MKQKYGVGVFVAIICSLLGSTNVSADVLVGQYDSTTTPAINDASLFYSSFLSGNYLYLNSSNGLSVINTLGTISQADDTLVATYDSASTPALSSSSVTHSFLSGNLLYISTTDGVTVIDTQGTEAQGDDTVVATYGDTSTPAIPGGSATHSFFSGDLLYVSAYGGGLVVIDTQGTPSQGDDTSVATYSSTSTPSIGSDVVWNAFVSGNYIYMSTDSNGLVVVDTLGTLASSDDTIVAHYRDVTTPALGALTVQNTQLIGNILYVSTNGGGLVVIDTQATIAQTDDVILATYNSASTPSITTDTVYHTFVSGNSLYLSTLNGEFVIDTQGTLTQTDDTITATYNTSSPLALQDNTARHAFVVADLLYISTESGDGEATYSIVQIVPTVPETATDTVNITLPVNATISITSPVDVTMGNIVGSGQSALATNSATWNVKTNNSTGYSLSWQASAAAMTNANLDTIAGYTPAVASTPEAWSVASTDSEWGAHLASTSSVVNTAVWGTGDDYATGNWLNVDSAAPYTIATSSSPTSITGDDEIIIFGGEIGTSKIQPTGTYSVDVTLTATTL